MVAPAKSLFLSPVEKGQVYHLRRYAKLLRDDAEQVFSFWGHGETSKLAPGSGLFVAQSGVSANHHFVLSVHRPAYEFAAGNYTVEVFARLAGNSTPIKLASIAIIVSDSHAAALRGGSGVLFELEPDKQVYVGHIDDRT